MADLESTLQGILSDPKAMEQIQALGKSLGLTSGNAESTNNPPKSTTDLSALSSLLNPAPAQSSSVLSGITDPDILSKITKFLPILGKMKGDDETTALLGALRPFLSDHRQKRLDDASKMLRIMRILPFIKDFGIL